MFDEPPLLVKIKGTELPDFMSNHADRPRFAPLVVLVAGCGELLTDDFFATFCDASAGYVIWVSSTLAKGVRV